MCCNDCHGSLVPRGKSLRGDVCGRCWDNRIWWATGTQTGTITVKDIVYVQAAMNREIPGVTALKATDRA